MNRSIVAFAAAAIVAGLGTPAAAGDKPATAQSVVSAAERTAKRQHKNVWVMFHASW